MRRSLLRCGPVASVLYVGIDVVAAIRHPEYHSFTSRMVSELMASGAPTERLVDPLFLLYDLLMMAFAVGVWTSRPGRAERRTAGLIFAYAALGLLGPTVFEMNVLGSGGDPLADVLHIAVTLVLVVLIFASVVSGARLFGRAFLRYSWTTIAVMFVFGALASLGAPRSGNDGAPWLGLAERVDIGAFLLWVVVFATALSRSGQSIMRSQENSSSARGSTRSFSHSDVLDP